MEISGALTKKRRITDVLAVVGLAAVLLWVAWMVSGSIGSTGSAGERRPLMLIVSSMGLLLLFGIALIGWEWWCTVTDYRFNGRFLSLRTYGRRGPQTINRADVVHVYIWRSKGIVTGYRFKLADGRQFFFSLQLQNVRELAEMISIELP